MSGEPPAAGAAEAEREAGALLSAAALASFRLNGRLLELAERLARPAGLTAAWWQVLGAVLREPASVAGIARAMGITRQSVQRIADLLVDKGLAEYRPNPAHSRAKLLAVTPEGLAAVRRIDPAHAESAARLAAEVGTERLRADVESLERLSAAVDALLARNGEGQPHPR
ncbi:DNA-binding MarR family transcriptional regulator [Murinocardiopsis flavida]|uniref:DNA-binding MarR family transcriptional regulator n=1 Tax=Murinocardiopsis flavida TaxID=645275 RepID=A0A2P8CV01_9ACTN|nr:helix-turn-helix domain-containing protein [Murinocardiopsis flavida]PSK88769.1 DNA-binding MarR family transcriptional regulator [Murinocardiopsis flavida]